METVCIRDIDDRTITTYMIRSKLQACGDIVRVEIPPTRGIAYVQFRTPEMAKYCLDYFHYTLRGYFNQYKVTVYRETESKLEETKVYDEGWTEGYYTAMWHAGFHVSIPTRHSSGTRHKEGFLDGNAKAKKDMDAFLRRYEVRSKRHREDSDSESDRESEGECSTR